MEPSWSGTVELVKSEKNGKTKWRKGFCFVFDGVLEDDWRPRLELHTVKAKAAQKQGAKPAETWPLWAAQTGAVQAEASEGPKKTVPLKSPILAPHCGYH